MAFDTLTPRLKVVANSALQYFTARYGRTALVIEDQIDKSISWKPSFHLRGGACRIIAIEADEVLYPVILNLADHDIREYGIPISVYVACPLEVYQADITETGRRHLKRLGIGLITVDDDGIADNKLPAIALAQHISEDKVAERLHDMPVKVKAAFKQAHSTYEVDEGQGLQLAGQIVEDIINTFASGALSKGFITGYTAKTPLAGTIDLLYNSNGLVRHRAALGGARAFVASYRNVVSHAPRSGKAAMDRINVCRTGFLNAIEVAGKICAAMKLEHITVRLNVT